MRKSGEEYRKTLVTTAGLQDDDLYFLNPNQVFSLRTGHMIDQLQLPLIWISDWPGNGLPREDLYHTIKLPVAIEPFQEFLDLARTHLRNNFGAAVIAWSYLLIMFRYSWVLRNFRHFNLPVLYGVPSVGKTLIATCGAWLCGCQDTQIASRCTLPFLLQWLTTSTMPFIWDDPSNPDEVGQLAVDIGNGAVRGKSTEMAVPPLTSCLVTANFDLASVARHNSRLCVIKLVPLNGPKQPGVARLLESQASEASAALPILLNKIAEIEAQQVFDCTQQLSGQVSVDIRVLEGIAVPLVTARKVLAAAGREHYIADVEQYVADTMLPYVSEQMPTSDNCANILLKKLLDFPDSIPNNVEIKDTTIRIIRNHLIEIGVRETTISQLGKDTSKVVRMFGGVKRATVFSVTSVEPHLLGDLQRALQPEQPADEPADEPAEEPADVQQLQEPEIQPLPEPQVMQPEQEPEDLPHGSPILSQRKRVRPLRHCRKTKSSLKLK